MREVLPALEGRGFHELLDRVYETGEPAEVAGARLLVERRADGRLEEAYLDFVYQPLRNRDGEVTGIYVHGIDVTDRKRAEDRSTFLAEAAVMLASSLDVEATLASVARLAVPRLADWCVVYVLEGDGSIRRLAVEHSGDRAAEVMALLERHPLDPEAEVGVPAVIRSGTPILRPDLPLEDVVGDTVDPESLAAVLRDLAITSYLCVPLIARGRTLGAISLLEGETSRRFGPAELEIAEELARRAALAVDNAFLYRAAEEHAGLLDAVLASAPVGIGFWDRDLRYIRVNETLAMLNRLPAEEHAGRTLREVVPEFADVLEPIYRRVIETGEPFVQEESTEMLAPRLGTDRHWLSSYYPVRTTAGEVIGLGAVIMEITERKRMEAAVRESDVRRKFVLDSAEIGEWDLDVETGEAWRSLRHDQIFGYEEPLPDWSYDRFLEHVVPEDREHVERRFLAAIESRQGWDFECRVERADGAIAWIWTRGFFATATRMVGLLLDITSRKRSEGRLRLLEQATRILGSSLSYEETLGEVAEAVRASMADRADVFLLEAGEPRRIATAADGRELPLPEGLPLETTLRDGASVLTPGGAALLVPVATTTQTLGALVLVRDSGPAYDDDDLAVAEELGRRAGLAIENARLYRAAQEAITLFEAQREASVDGVLVVSPEGRILSYNRRFAEIWQLSEDALGTDAEALTRAAPKLVDPDGFQRRVAAVYADPVPSYDELALVDGRVIERYGAPVRSEDGTYYGYLWSFRDVTERRRAVEELEKLGSLVEASEDFVAMADLEGRLIYLNAAGRRLVGLEPGRDVLETTVRDYATPESWEQWESAGLPAMRERGSWSGQWTIRHLGSGEAIEVEGTVFLVRHPETRKALAFASVQRDIRERRRVERELEARAQSARALQFVGDGVFLVDDEAIVRLWNPAVAAMTGVAAGEVEGRPAAEVVPGWADIVARVAIAGAGDRIARSETLPIEVGGQELWLSISGVAFAEGTVFAVRDVTEERGLERLKSDFVSTVSHELRTPLAAIYGAALTLRRDGPPLGEDMRSDLLGVIADEADRLARIVNDILWTSRIESGGLRVTIVSVDPVELASGVVQAARLHAPPGIALELVAADGLPRVAADPDKVRQVLANLVDNAVKYSPDGGRIEVTLEPRGQMLRFTVRDEGLGIPPAERDRVFEKFYRLDPDLTRGVGGTGLGLYICRELVRRMNGWIWVEPSPPAGTALIVELPVQPDVSAHVL